MPSSKKIERRDPQPSALDARTEREMMLAGEGYYCSDPELIEMSSNCRRLCAKLNDLSGDRPNSPERQAIFQELLGGFHDSSFLLSPFRCDYGKNIFVGERVFFNMNTVILDCNTVTIGNDVMFGPNVSLYAATHPLDPEVRNRGGPEYALPITIKDDVWIGGSAVIVPGVTIGKGGVVGAGSVVTKDVDDYCVVAGNPARVIKRRVTSPDGETSWVSV